MALRLRCAPAGIFVPEGAPLCAEPGQDAITLQRLLHRDDGRSAVVPRQLDFWKINEEWERRMGKV